MRASSRFSLFAGLRVVVLLALLTSSAFAQQDRVSGFSTQLEGVITGQVTDDSGDPVANITVYATTTAGELTAVTDQEGRYRIDLGKIPGSKMIFVRRLARINGQTTLPSTAADGEEVVEILETDQPAVMPKATAPTNRILDYTEAAIKADAWTKAWLLLHVGRDGEVKRLKVLHTPGYGLTPTAVNDAFNLKFEPALDRAGRPVPVLIVWSYEWPSYYWLVEHRYPPRFVPAEVNAVPCRGTSGKASRQRDCTQAEMGLAHKLPWIERKSYQTNGKIEAVGKSALKLPPPPPPPAKGVLHWYDSKVGWTLVGMAAVFMGTSGYLFYSAGQLDERAAMTDRMLFVLKAKRQDAASVRRAGGYIFGAIGVGFAIGGFRHFSMYVANEEAGASLSWKF